MTNLHARGQLKLDKYASREFKKQLRHVLLTEWDPIGVRHINGPQDEYDIYLGDILHLLKTNASEVELAIFLRSIEIERMGMSPSSVPDRTHVAATLIRIYRGFEANDAA